MTRLDELVAFRDAEFERTWAEHVARLGPMSDHVKVLAKLMFIAGANAGLEAAKRMAGGRPA